jgi:hypothetical protein
MFRQLGSLLFVILVLKACLPTATSAPVNTQTYHNAAVGFEVDYPQAWLIDATNEASGTVILWSRKVDGPGRDGVPADVAKIDIINPSITVQSLDELVAWEKHIIADGSHNVLHEKAVQLPSGLAAVQLHVSGVGEALVLLTLVNHQPLIVAGYGDLSRFSGVAQTLQPVPPTSAATLASPALAWVWHDECAVRGEGGSPATVSAGWVPARSAGHRKRRVYVSGSIRRGCHRSRQYGLCARNGIRQDLAVAQ